MSVPNTIHPLLQTRYSPLVFQDKPILKDILKRLFEAAQWAPSSYNEQPWRFVVGVKGEGNGWQKIFDCLVEGNQTWANSAPVLVLTVAKKSFAYNKADNPHAWHDVGLAMSQLIFQATSEQIFVHQMAGFDAQKARESLLIPDECEPVAVAALGYEGNITDITDPKLVERANAPRQRQSLSEIVFEDHFGNGLF
ncbi:MAG: Nitroreductase [Candidatus Uhrbacteria bacterium GW2011_GWF2_41_16]|uniref:Nitroreductase n=2 Tax=Candidatus Uhriibacteriota TaxID=1752732 RepID=A0A0G0YB33_9BACT|nr:MAG: Nitroreductase [Candidatus Uhrbacteria bacterium GW2011_GWC2_41_11]KKR97517.1 MAG: Nitroreductase [Candidatus Uhrbacteria bacterium GW2011_GWF2_41_16]HBP00019.1 nitroreductase [Candidatus Uhrbacteria bacterium]